MWKIENINQVNLDKLNSSVYLSFLNLNPYWKVYPIHWEHKIATYKTNDIIYCFTNIFIIKKYGIKLFYVPGGIEGKITNNIINDFNLFIHSLSNYKSIFFINFHNENISKVIIPKSFSKVISPFETRFIMKKYLTNINDLRSSYSKNWRHNLTRSYKREFELNIVEKPNIYELIELYNQMSSIKNFKVFITSKYLQFIFNELKNQIIHFEARINNKLIAFRTVIFNDSNAWDLLACSNAYSKNNYCTYRIMHEIFLLLINKNVKNFDFSGVDLKNNIGVYNFKKGAGSSLYRKIGEYVHSKNFILKLLFKIFIFLKRIFIK